MVSFVPLSYSEYISPVKQMKSGVAIEDVKCKENKILVLRSTGSPACVTEKTVERTGWQKIVKSPAVKTEDHLVKLEDSLSITPNMENYNIKEKDENIIRQNITEKFEQNTSSLIDEPNTDSESYEITAVLYRDSVYGNEGVGGVVVSASDNPLYYNIVDSEGRFIIPYHQGLDASGTLQLDSHYDVRISDHGRGTFGMTTNTLTPGDYAVIIYDKNNEIKLDFAVKDSQCCRPLAAGVEKGAYLPGEVLKLFALAPPHTTLTFGLIDPDNKVDKSKTVTTDKNGKLHYKYMLISRVATQGIWTLEVTDGKIYDSIPIIVIPAPDELAVKYPTSKEILRSYELALENKKSGYDVLLVSSLAPFVDDDRKYMHKSLEHRPAPVSVADLKHIGAWPETADFETNDYGVVTFLKTPHEKYSVNHGNGLYPQDWIPDYIPDGQKLLYAGVSYDLDNDTGKEIHGVSYNFVPTSFVIDKNTMDWQLKNNMGFRVNVIHENYQDEFEDILEELKDRHAKKYKNYGGYETRILDGEQIVLFEGGYSKKHYENRIYWMFGDNYGVFVSSYYYTLDELILIVQSMVEKKLQNLH